MNRNLLALALILACTISIVNTADKLKITLYIESLCPDCKNTVQGSFTPAIKNGLLDMAEVNYVTAGNASSENFKRGTMDYNFKCQHNDAECYANIYSNCMNNMAESEMQKFLYFDCMFNNLWAAGVDKTSTMKDILDVWNVCLNKFVSEDQQRWVFYCSFNGKGFNLFDDAIKATPKHDFIPWAAVEGKTLTQADRDLINSDVLKWACDNFEGTKPESCKSSLRFLPKTE